MERRSFLKNLLGAAVASAIPKTFIIEATKSSPPILNVLSDSNRYMWITASELAAQKRWFEEFEAAMWWGNSKINKDLRDGLISGS